MEFFNDVRVLAGIFIGAPLVYWLQWTKSREASWQLRTRKREAARALFKDSAWRKASPFDFHFAMGDAFGRSIEPCELHFIESRQDPVRLLMNRISAGASVRFVPKDQRYVDSRRKTRFSLGFVSTSMMLTASVSVPTFGIAAFWAWKSSSYFLMGMAVFYGVAVFLTAFMISMAADAARFVLSGEGHEPVDALASPGALGAAVEQAQASDS